MTARRELLAAIMFDQSGHPDEHQDPIAIREHSASAPLRESLMLIIATLYAALMMVLPVLMVAFILILPVLEGSFDDDITCAGRELL